MKPKAAAHVAGIGHGGAIRLSEEIDVDGDAFLDAACEMGLEGIIAKHRDRPYRSGRKGDWLKIKCVMSETFAVVGYEPSTKVRGAIANLLLAARKDGELVYVGSVGTGFTYAQTVALKKQLDAMRAEKPPVALKRKAVVFARPELIAEVEFRAWTASCATPHSRDCGRALIPPRSMRSMIEELVRESAQSE
jgi:bifunctional non-homologous end joining protein LigD